MLMFFKHALSIVMVWCLLVSSQQVIAEESDAKDKQAKELKKTGEGDFAVTVKLNSENVSVKDKPVKMDERHGRNYEGGGVSPSKVKEKNNQNDK